MKKAKKEAQFVECKSCRRDVSLKARACPHCGASRVRWHRQRVYAAIAILIGFFWIAGSYSYNVEIKRHYVGNYPIAEERNTYQPDSGAGLLMLVGVGWYVVSVCMDRKSNKKTAITTDKEKTDEG